MAPKKVFAAVTDMEPLLPEDRTGKLEELGLEIIRRAERLRCALHPVTRRSVVDLVRSMNSYYSNLIEGHRATPRDIEAALRREFRGDRKQRDLQQLHWALVETQRWMESELPGRKLGEICGEDFLRPLHRDFYTRLPAAFQEVQDEAGRKFRVQSGTLRASVVSVDSILRRRRKSFPTF